MNEWIECSKRLPTETGDYFVMIEHLIDDEKYYHAQVIMWCEGWNCHRSLTTGEICRENEFHDVVAWMPVPPYKDGE